MKKQFLAAIEVKALAKLEALRQMMALRDFIDEGPIGKRRLPKLSEPEPCADATNDDEDDLDEKPEATVSDQIDFEAFDA